MTTISVSSKIKQNIILKVKFIIFTAFTEKSLQHILQKHVCFMLPRKSFQYVNMPMHYAAILNSSKNDVFNENFEYFPILLKT